MSSNFFLADVSFPHLDENKSDGENLREVTNYLFMLLEQLRYTLGNIGRENFNDTELEGISNDITEPVCKELRGLSGEVSTFTQTVNGLRLSVSNGQESSVLQLMSGETLLSSADIQIKGMVTFAALSGSGTSVINGDNIKTGTISAINIYGVNIDGSTITAATINMLASAFEPKDPKGEIIMYVGEIDDTSGIPNRLGGIRPELGDFWDGAGARARVVIYSIDLMGELGGVELRGSTIILNGDVYMNGQLVSART